MEYILICPLNLFFCFPVSLCLCAVHAEPVPAGVDVGLVCSVPGQGHAQTGFGCQVKQEQLHVPRDTSDQSAAKVLNEPWRTYCNLSTPC